MNTNEEEQIHVDPCVLVLDFIHANDNLVSETAEMGFVGGTIAAATPQRVGPAAAGRPSPPDICAFGKYWCHRLAAASRSTFGCDFARDTSASRTDSSRGEPATINESAYRCFRLAQYDHTTNRSRVIEFYCDNGLCGASGNRLRLW
jgi:hypothetical protein